MDDEEEEENDGFIVPHGYLSDDEGVDGDEVSLSIDIAVTEVHSWF